MSEETIETVKTIDKPKVRRGPKGRYISAKATVPIEPESVEPNEAEKEALRLEALENDHQEPELIAWAKSVAREHGTMTDDDLKELRKAQRHVVRNADAIAAVTQDLNDQREQAEADRHQS